jgi:hypothetical protein
VIASGRWRPVGLLALLCTLFGCAPLEVWNFDDDAGAPGTDATAGSTADAIAEQTSDATVEPADTSVPSEAISFDAPVGEPTDGRVPRFDASDPFRRHDGGEPPPVDASSDGSIFERCETDCSASGFTVWRSPRLGLCASPAWKTASARPKRKLAAIRNCTAASRAKATPTAAREMSASRARRARRTRASRPARPLMSARFAPRIAIRSGPSASPA